MHTYWLAVWIHLCWARYPVSSLVRFPRQLFSSFMTVRDISDCIMTKMEYLLAVSPEKPGMKAQSRSCRTQWGFCDLRGAVSIPSWTQRLNCPFSDLAMTELEQRSCQARSEGFSHGAVSRALYHYLLPPRQPGAGNSPAAAFQCSIQFGRTIRFNFTLPNGLTSDITLREHCCFCHTWKMYARNEIVLWKHLTPCALWKYEHIILYQNKATLLKCQQ